MLWKSNHQRKPWKMFSTDTDQFEGCLYWPLVSCRRVDTDHSNQLDTGPGRSISGVYLCETTCWSSRYVLCRSRLATFSTVHSKEEMVWLQERLRSLNAAYQSMEPPIILCLSEWPDSQTEIGHCIHSDTASFEPGDGDSLSGTQSNHYQ